MSTLKKSAQVVIHDGPDGTAYSVECYNEYGEHVLTIGCPNATHAVNLCAALKDAIEITSHRPPSDIDPEWE